MSESTNRFSPGTRRLLWLASWTIAGTWVVRGVVTLYFMGYLPRVEVVADHVTAHHYTYGFLIAIVAAFSLVTIGTARPWTWKILAAFMGFGTGMVFDETIMAVNRQAHYWHEGWWIGPVGSTLVLVIAVICLALFQRNSNPEHS